MIRYADDFVCLVQHKQDAIHIEDALSLRFIRCELELHPEKSRRISFGSFEVENAKKQNRRANTFDFLGITHYCDKTKKGYFKLGRKTSRKKFNAKCKDMTDWLKGIRNKSQLKCWWPTLKSKLRGHFQYYGISENVRGIKAFYNHTVKALFKWLNRRSQKRSMTWENFNKYLEMYFLPKPKLAHNFYT